MNLLQDFAVVLVIAGIVGLLFRRMGLSAIVGYLVAGMIIGPYTPPFSLVADVDRVEQLSQFGLVFLLFFVGMELNLNRIRAMGFSLVWATALLTLLVFNFCKLFAGAMRWNEVAIFVFASMFVVSSSAIISKMLLENRLGHERYAHNALGITILEDVVVIILITLLSSKVHLAGLEGHGGGVTGNNILGLFAGFVTLTMVAGILFLPTILKRFSRAADMDLKVIIVAGLVFATAVITGKAGFSPALGAFLFGVVVSGTAFKHKIEKSLVGTQDIFSAVFFASIGMLIDVKTVHHHLWLVIGVTAFIIPMRVFAATLSFLIMGSEYKTAIRTALILTPIGEFSYILAQIGVQANVGVPDYFYVIAVGSSILTSIIAPQLVKNSGAIADFIVTKQPRFLARAINVYQVWLREIADRQEKVKWWKLVSPRLGRLGLEIILLIGLLIYSAALHDFMHQMMANMKFSFEFSSYVYWAAVGIVCLTLCVAIWRSIDALSMICADIFIDSGSQARHLRPIIRLAGQTVGAVGLLWLVWLLFPMQLAGTMAGWVVLAVSLAFIALFWRKLIQWHSRFQHSLNTVISGSAPSLTSTVTPQESEFWHAQLAECVLPDHAACTMKSIASLELRRQFGCAIVEIERHGELMSSPSPDTILFAGDKLLLFGAARNIKPTLDFLQTETPRAASAVSTVRLDTFMVRADSSRVGRSLAQLQIFAQTGVQVLGIEHDGKATLNPAANHELRAGDRLLVLCTAAQGRNFRKWLE